MTTGSNNVFPKIVLEEQASTPATPAAGTQKLFIDSADGKLKRVDESDVVTEVGGGGSGSDTTAIHDNVTGEINALTEKVTPVAGDMLLIEDSAASFAKKKVDIGNLPGGSGSVVVSDNFNRADSSTVGAPQIGNTPVEHAGATPYSGNWKIASNKVAAETSIGENYVIWDTGILSMKITVGMTTRPSDGGVFFKCWNDGGNVNGWYLHTPVPGEHYRLYFKSGTSFSLIEDTSVYAADGDVIVITWDRGKMVITINGTTLITRYHTAASFGTLCGLRQNTGTNGSWDYITVETYP